MVALIIVAQGKSIIITWVTHEGGVIYMYVICTVLYMRVYILRQKFYIVTFVGYFEIFTSHNLSDIYVQYIYEKLSKAIKYIACDKIKRFLLLVFHIHIF